MLVLSRREGESIRIGDDIELVVTQIRGGRVRLGIRAPRDVAVHRAELGVRDLPQSRMTPRGISGGGSKPEMLHRALAPAELS